MSLFQYSGIKGQRDILRDLNKDVIYIVIVSVFSFPIFLWHVCCLRVIWLLPVASATPEDVVRRSPSDHGRHFSWSAHCFHFATY